MITSRVEKPTFINANVTVGEQVYSVEITKNTKHKLTYEVFRPTSALTFVLTDDKTLVAMHLQTFIIGYQHPTLVPRYQRLREMIRNGGMRSITDVVAFCKPYSSRGNGKYINGLIITPTLLKRHIDV